jgi:CRP/FNR family transcriptional regulator
MKHGIEHHQGGRMEVTAREDTGVKQQILRRIYLFAGIAEADLLTLARMAVKKTFPRQTTIFWEGKEAQGFYLLITGQIKLVKSSPEGKEYIIRLVGPGETFAEAAVFGEIPYPATGIALEDCHTLFFPKGPFLQHLAASPALARNMLATLSRLMFHLTKQLEDLSLKEVSARVARYISGHHQ